MDTVHTIPHRTSDFDTQMSGINFGRAMKI
jgi:hypothetical protein